MALTPVLVSTVSANKLTIRWLETYVSEGLNRKALGVDKGIVRGFNAQVGASDHEIDLLPDPTHGDSVMVVQPRGGEFALTYRESGTLALDLSDFAGKTVIVWFEHVYAVSATTSGRWRAAELDGGVQGSIDQVRDLGIGLCIVKLNAGAAPPDWVLTVARDEQGRDVGDGRNTWQKVISYQFNEAPDIALATEGLPSISGMGAGDRFRGSSSHRFGAGDIATTSDLGIQIPAIGILPELRSEVAVMIIAKVSSGYSDTGGSSVTMFCYDETGALVDTPTKFIDIANLATAWRESWLTWPADEVDPTTCTFRLMLLGVPDDTHYLHVAEISAFVRAAVSVTSIADADRATRSYEGKVFSSVGITLATAPTLNKTAVFDMVTDGPRVWSPGQGTLELGRRWTPTTFHTMALSVLGDASFGASTAGKVSLGQAATGYTYATNEEVGGVYFGRTAALMPSGKRAAVYAVVRADAEVELRLASLVNSTVNDAVRVLAKNGSDQPTEVTLFAKGNADTQGKRVIDLNFVSVDGTTEYVANRVRSQRSGTTGTQASALMFQVNKGSVLRTAAVIDHKAFMIPRDIDADTQLLLFNRTVSPADDLTLAQVNVGAIAGSVSAEDWDTTGGASSGNVGIGARLSFFADGAWDNISKMFPTKMKLQMCGGGHKNSIRDVFTFAHDATSGAPYLEIKNATDLAEETTPTRYAELRFAGRTGAGLSVQTAKISGSVLGVGGNLGQFQIRTWDGTDHVLHMTWSMDFGLNKQTAMNGAAYAGPLSIGGLTSEAYTNELVYNTTTKAVAYTAKSFTGFHNYGLPTDSQLARGDAVCLSGEGVVISSAPRDPTCVGIIAQTRGDAHHSMTGKKGDTVARVAGVGDSREHGVGLDGFKVCDEGGPITAGTLLCTSSRPGRLMAQGDDLVRSYTVGKSLQAVTFDASGNAGGVYGILMCG